MSEDQKARMLRRAASLSDQMAALWLRLSDRLCSPIAVTLPPEDVEAIELWFVESCRKAGVPRMMRIDPFTGDPGMQLHGIWIHTDADAYERYRRERA